MTLQKLYDILSSTGIPTTYYDWHGEKPPNPPYIVYFVIGSNNFSADNHVYSGVCNVRIELYTAKKDIETEKIIENVLKDFFWDKSEVYIKSTQSFMISYDISIITNTAKE